MKSGFRKREGQIGLFAQDLHTGKMIKKVRIENNGNRQIDLQLSNLSAAYHYSLIVDGEVKDSKKMILK